MDLDIKGLRVLVTAGASGHRSRDRARIRPRRCQGLHLRRRHRRATRRRGQRPRICSRRFAMSPTRRRWRGCSIRQRAHSAASMRWSTTPASPALPQHARTSLLADWQRTLAVNLTGQFLCAQRAIPWLKKSRNASIANLSSAAGRFGFPLRTPVRCIQMGRDRALEITIDRTRSARRTRQCDMPRLGRRPSHRCGVCQPCRRTQPPARRRARRRTVQDLPAAPRVGR